MATSSTVTASARNFTSANTEFFSHADNDIFTFGNGTTDSAFSGGGWIYLDDNTAVALIYKTTGVTGSNAEYAFYVDGTSKLSINLYDASASNTIGLESNSTLSTATWYHVAFTYDGSGTNAGLTLYVDGSAVSTTSTDAGSYTAMENGTGTFKIGNGFNGNYFDGRMQAFFLSDSELTSSEISTIATSSAGFWKDLGTTLQNKMVGFWDMVESTGIAYDATSNGLDLTDNNTVGALTGLITYTSQKSAQFTSANSEYLSLSNADLGNLSPGDQDFTIATVIKADSFPDANATPIAAVWTNTSNQREWILHHAKSLNRLRFLVSGDGTTGTLGIVAADNFGDVPTGKSLLVVARHDATANTIEIGVNAGTFNSTSYSSGVFQGTSPFHIGAQQISNADEYDGTQQSFGFWTRKLSDAEVTTLYNRGFMSDYQRIIDEGLDTSLEAFWNLNEESGSRLDSVGSKDLTDNNTVTQADGVVLLTEAAGGGSTSSFVDVSGIIQ